MDLKVAAINDLSGLGRCSLAADMTVLGALGIQACAVPTAVLTGQTEYPGYYSTDLTKMIPRFADHWSGLNLSLDGILTGFLSSAEQARAVNELIDRFRTDQNVLLVDPVMGDSGYVYDNYTPELRQEILRLVSRADIITPNISELCLLAGRPIRELQEMDGKTLMRSVLAWSEELARGNRQTVIVTGIPEEALKTDADISLRPDHLRDSPVIGNLVMSPDFCRIYRFPYERGSYSGTGDLFAAMMLGGYLQNLGWEKIIPCAGQLLADGVHDARLAGSDRNDGIPYEKYLGRLTELIGR